MTRGELGRVLLLGAGTFVVTLAVNGRNARGAKPALPPAAAPPGVTPRVSPRSATWVWPVPGIVVEGRAIEPSITNGWGSPRRTLDGRARQHRGADIMFRAPGQRRPFVPDGTLAIAASAGVVRWAGPDFRGLGVIIDHGNGWSTYYTHLATLLVAKGETVVVGHPLGVIGDDPTDPDDRRHLHFEIRRGRAASDAVDPAPFLAAWGVVWLPARRNAAGGSLVYRPVGARGEAYPEWVRNLRGKSGVYVIRERNRRGDAEVVYVGESHSGKLYETLTRHFQIWRRWKGWWSGQFGEGHDPGLTYDRERVEVAVRVTSPDDAIDEEARLIRRLRPRDNRIGQVEEVPF